DTARDANEQEARSATRGRAQASFLLIGDRGHPSDPRLLEGGERRAMNALAPRTSRRSRQSLLVVLASELDGLACVMAMANPAVQRGRRLVNGEAHIARGSRFALRGQLPEPTS